MASAVSRQALQAATQAGAAPLAWGTRARAAASAGARSRHEPPRQGVQRALSGRPALVTSANTYTCSYACCHRSSQAVGVCSGCVTPCRNKPVSRTRKNGALRAGVFRRRLFLRGIFLRKKLFFVQKIKRIRQKPTWPQLKTSKTYPRWRRTHTWEIDQRLGHNSVTDGTACCSDGSEHIKVVAAVRLERRILVFLWISEKKFSDSQISCNRLKRVRIRCACVRMSSSSALRRRAIAMASVSSA